MGHLISVLNIYYSFKMPYNMLPRSAANAAPSAGKNNFPTYLHTIYMTMILFPLWKRIGMVLCPILTAPLNIYVNHILSNDNDDIVFCLVMKGFYDFMVWFVQNAFFYDLIRTTKEDLLLRINMAKVKCGALIPGVNLMQHKDLIKNCSKLQDFLFVIPMTWSSLVNFSVSIATMDIQSDYPVRFGFALFCVSMVALLTYLTDASLYERTKPSPTSIDAFDDAQLVRMKLSMGCSLNPDFEAEKKRKMKKQQRIQKCVILGVNLIVTYISLIGKNIGQLHAFGNISWMIGCLADNLKSFQYYSYMKEFIALTTCLEAHTLETIYPKVPPGRIDRVSFKNASFGYYDGDLTKNPSRVIKIMNLTYTFRRGKFYYLEAPNGVGKSTVLKMFTNNLFGGNVFFGSTNRDNLEFADIHRTIAYLPQASEYTPSFTPIEIEPYRGRDSWLEERLGLSPLFGKDTVEISGGQKKRLWLYITLTSDCPLILLDETLSELSTEETPDVPEGGGWLTRILTSLIAWEGRRQKIIVLVGHGLIQMIPQNKTIINLKIDTSDKKTVLSQRA